MDLARSGAGSRAYMQSPDFLVPTPSNNTPGKHM